MDFLPGLRGKLRGAKPAAAITSARSHFAPQKHTPLALASRLPPKILLAIFRDVLADCGCISSSAPLSYPKVLSHVCSSWRQLAISACDLWVHIDVGHLELNPRLHIERSGGLPVYVHVQGSLHMLDPLYSSTGNITSTLGVSLARRTKTLHLDQHILYIEGTALKAFLENCTPGLLTRIVNSNVYLPKKHRFILAQEQKLPGHAIGHDVIRLNITEQHLENITLGLKVFQSAATCPVWDSKAYHGLTDLCLGSDGIIPESLLVAILKSSPRLQSLEIALKITDILPTTSQVEPVHLVDLERVRADDLCHGGLLLRWIAPGSKPLRLLLTDRITEDFDAVPFMSNQLRMFLRRSNVTRAYIHLYDSYSNLVDIFSTATSVRELAVDCTYRAAFYSDDRVWNHARHLNLDTLYLIGQGPYGLLMKDFRSTLDLYDVGNVVVHMQRILLDGPGQTPGVRASYPSSLVLPDPIRNW